MSWLGLTEVLFLLLLGALVVAAGVEILVVRGRREKDDGPPGE
jgi:hypothetical protein